MDFYCMKCKRKVNAEPTSSEKMKGRSTRLNRAKCPKCGTKVARISAG